MVSSSWQSAVVLLRTTPDTGVDNIHIDVYASIQVEYRHQQCMPCMRCLYGAV